MSNYIDAYKKGLQAAEEADQARKEIDEVFVELSNQIGEASAGMICIKRREKSVPRGYLEQMTRVAAGLTQEKYWAIVAYNPKAETPPEKELAKWDQDPRGYPCRIVWGDTKYFCEDREALETNLAKLISDPITGETLYALTKLELKQPENSSSQQEDSTEEE